MTSILPGTTSDLIGENITALKSIFPEAFREDKIDFDTLKMLLSDYITTDKEAYNFTRGGKRDALKLALEQTTGTLRPDHASSKNWDNTENLYIEGDNLEVLRVMQDSYRGQVKMIYIDPPYNTGNDFVYKDDFHDNVASYKEKMGENMKSNPETNGRYHTDWLNMMYPRLKLARNLLKDDGVIFMSIDDNEVHNLRKIADEVFGEENFVGKIARMMKSGGNKGQFFSPNIEYILVFARSIFNLGVFREAISDETITASYNNIEESGEKKGEKYSIKGLCQPGLGIRKNQRYWIKCPDGSFIIPRGKNIPADLEEGVKVIPTDEDTCWKWTYDRYKIEKENGNILFKQSSTATALIDEHGNTAKWNVFNKIWLTDRQDEGRVPVNFISKWENRISSQELKELGILFDFAKPSKLISYIISILDDSKESLILDFFSGSATTAHAVMALNAEDGGSRKYIMVQIPETTDENSEANKAGYRTICEIGKERIRRAGEKIKEENKDNEGIDKLDIGFKCFTLDTTNLKKREINPLNINETLLNFANPIKDERSTEDMLYEIMLKKGLELTTPVDTQIVSEKTVYIVGGGSLIVCLDMGITLDLIHRMIALEPEIMKSNAHSTIVLYDAGFATDTDKTNAVHQIEKAGLNLLVI